MDKKETVALFSLCLYSFIIGVMIGNFFSYDLAEEKCIAWAIEKDYAFYDKFGTTLVWQTTETSLLIHDLCGVLDGK